MENKIKRIISKMQGELTAEQLKRLNDVLTLVLFEEDVKKNELMCYDENIAVLNIFFASLKVGCRSEQTIKKYALDIKNLLSFLNNKPVTEVNTNDIRYYLAWYKENRNVSNTTLENMRLTFVSFFGWLENEDYIAKSPMRKIGAIKKDTQPERCFTPDEIERLKFGAKSTRDRAIISFLASTCCRVSEMCNADKSDVDFDRREVLVHGKGDKDRVVYLDEVSCYYLKEYLKQRTDDNPALFVTAKGEVTRIKKNSVERLFARLGNRLGIEGVHPHRFRSSQITNLLKKGMSIQLVQSLAGHSNINTTEHYYRNDKTLVKNEFMRLC